MCFSARIQILAPLYKLCAALNNLFHSIALLVFLIHNTRMLLLSVSHRIVISTKGYAYPQRGKSPERGETVLYDCIAGDPVATVVKQMKSALC